MATLESLFAGRNLTRRVQGIKSGLKLSIPTEFLTPNDEAIGNVAEWFEFDGNRKMAQVVAQDSPAKRVGHQGARKRSATCLRSFEKQAFAMNKLQNLMQVEGEQRDNLGAQYINRQTQELKQRLTNLKQSSAQSMLFRFGVHFDENGSLLPSSTGATVSVTPEIAAGQQGQLDILGEGAIIGASWATASTDIIGHLESIVEQMFRLAGWTITEAFYGKNIPKHIATNDGAKEYINRTPALATQRFESANKVPDGFQELNWHKASNTQYLDESGAWQKLLGDDEIVFTPAPSPEWWANFRGTEMVPNGVVAAQGNVSDAVSMLSNVSQVSGEFSYAAMSHDPLSIEQFVGDNFLPVIRATKAVCKADVTP